MLNDLSAYIPQDRRRALLSGAALPDRTSGAAMFADISGFTPLAEALVGALGPRRGAEELTSLLNGVYSALIAEVERFGGSVISFSGDAMTCWFDDGRVERSVQSSALRAVACALAMRQAMSAFHAIAAPGGAIALSVKVAVASGPVRRFLLGDPQIQNLDVLAGPTLDRLGASAQLAERDDVVVDARTLDEIAPEVIVAAWRVDPSASASAAVIAELRQPLELAPAPAHLGQDVDAHCARPWILPAVYRRLRGSAAPFLAELRPAVALMLQFSGLDYDANDAGALLDAYIRQVQAIVARYEGTLIDITMADKGGYLYAAFGAPVAHEDDPARALRAALELRDLPLGPAHGTVRIGLSQGAMRTGPYGGESRRTYGVLGDEVNLACRLMSAAAPGQILASGRLGKALNGDFLWSALPAMQVKGKRAPVELYRLLGESPAARSFGQALAPSDMVGRSSERATLAEAVAALLSGAGGVLVIEGEPGLGKSRLIAELAEMLLQHGAAGLAGAGRSIEQQTPYRAWRDIFSAYFELDNASGPAERREQIVALASAAVPELIERLPLLNDVLNLGLPETQLTSSLTGSLRSDSLGGLLVELLRARARSRPLALVIEDAHWLDSRSWGLAVRVARTLVAEQVPLLLVVATRRLESAHLGMPHLRALLGSDGVRWLRLEQLPEQATLALAAARLGLAADELPEPVAALLRERAGGNPFFAEELVATLRERGLIRIEAEGDNPLARPRCVVAGDLRAAGLLPDTLQGLLLARVDRLPPEQQITLKVASVIGPTFAFAPLHFARGRQSPTDGGELKEQLRDLAAQDYTALEEPEPGLSYRFKHILTQEAAYETLLYAQRRALHQTVAGWYESAFGAKDEHGKITDDAAPAELDRSSPIVHRSLAPYYPLLAHHYRRAESPERERHYAWLAGIQAAEQYANAEAVIFFSQALELTPAHDLAGRYQVLFEREAAEELLADRAAQARDLAELEALAEALGDDRRRAEIARSQARYAERVGNVAEMRVIAARAVALAEAAGAAETAIRAYDQWAWACLRAGAYGEARERAEAGLRIARAHGDRRNEAQMLTALGCAYSETEDYPMAQALLEQSLQIFRDLGRQRGESVALGNLAEAVAQQGDYATARGYLEQSLRLHRMTGDRRNEGWILGNLGGTAMHMGDYAAARSYHQQARELARTTGDRNTESNALIDLGLVAHQLGDHAAALEYGTEALAVVSATFTRFRGLLVQGHALAGLGQESEAAASYAEARELAQAAALPAKTAEAAAGLARLALGSAHLAGALAAIEPVVPLLEHATLSGADEPLRVFLTCSQVLRAAGDPRAGTILTAAHTLLQARAAKLPSEAARRMFLENVPYHRAIVAEFARA